MAVHSSFSATEGFTVLFWLELASPHILPLCRALANYPNIQVVVVYINDADSARLTQGWVQCSLDGLFSFRLTSEFELSTILASLPRQLDPIHIFQGIRFHPAFASHYSFCRASRHLILHYQEQLLLHPELDAADGAGDLARDEGLAAARALVVEEDAAARVHAVALAVVHGDPVTKDLGAAVG